MAPFPSCTTPARVAGEGASCTGPGGLSTPQGGVPGRLLSGELLGHAEPHGELLHELPGGLSGHGVGLAGDVEHEDRERARWRWCRCARRHPPGRPRPAAGSRSSASVVARDGALLGSVADRPTGRGVRPGDRLVVTGPAGWRGVGRGGQLVVHAGTSPRWVSSSRMAFRRAAATWSPLCPVRRLSDHLRRRVDELVARPRASTYAAWT